MAVDSAAGGAVVVDDLGKLLRELYSLYVLSEISPVAAKISPVGAGTGEEFSGVTGAEISPVAGIRGESSSPVNWRSGVLPR